MYENCGIPIWMVIGVLVQFLMALAIPSWMRISQVWGPTIALCYKTELTRKAKIHGYYHLMWDKKSVSWSAHEHRFISRISDLSIAKCVLWFWTDNRGISGALLNSTSLRGFSISRTHVLKKKNSSQNTNSFEIASSDLADSFVRLRWAVYEFPRVLSHFCIRTLRQFVELKKLSEGSFSR